MTFHIRIEDEELIQKIIEIQEKLSTIPCIYPFPRDYFHISVKGCGFLAKSEIYVDDILTKNLRKIVNQAEKVLEPFDKFDVLLSKLNVFPQVVLVEVHDKGKIGEINQTLQTIEGIEKMEFDYPNFLPHISIAQFQNDLGFARLISQLEELRETEFGELSVNRIELVNAHLSRGCPNYKTINSFKFR